MIWYCLKYLEIWECQECCLDMNCTNISKQACMYSRFVNFICKVSAKNCNKRSNSIDTQCYCKTDCLLLCCFVQNTQMHRHISPLLTSHPLHSRSVGTGVTETSCTSGSRTNKYPRMQLNTVKRSQLPSTLWLVYGQRPPTLCSYWPSTARVGGARRVRSSSAQHFHTVSLFDIYTFVPAIFLVALQWT